MSNQAPNSDEVPPTTTSEVEEIAKQPELETAEGVTANSKYYCT